MNQNSLVYASLAKLLDQKVPFVMVTLVDVLLSAPQDVGAKMLVTGDGLLAGTVGGGKLEAAALAKSLELLHGKTPVAARGHGGHLVRWNLKKDLGMTCGGEASLFFELHQFDAWKIAVFGAGHVSQALVRLLLTLDCQITVIDQRQEWLDSLPEDKKLLPVCVSPLEAYVSSLPADTYIVSVTQGHACDLPLVEAVLRSRQPPYIGVIGSDSKAFVLRRDLKLRGIPEEQGHSVFCPIGIPLESRSPPEIAVSIAAQLLQVRGEALKKLSG